MILLPCKECGHEHSLHCDSETTVTCSNCERVWSLEWESRLGMNMPKLTLIDDGDDHFEIIGATSRQVIASSTVAKRHFEQMAGLQALNNKIRIRA